MTSKSHLELAVNATNKTGRKGVSAQMNYAKKLIDEALKDAKPQQKTPMQIFCEQTRNMSFGATEVLQELGIEMI